MSYCALARPISIRPPGLFSNLGLLSTDKTLKQQLRVREKHTIFAAPRAMLGRLERAVLSAGGAAGIIGALFD